ncbi:MAG: xanthine dehydrogenase family protein molybdopterin-binding subunit, partial [Chloroflexi bacterium]|nr:xanthine dehydrogenase family protein molybdopterin-binding subunit [Chloroflexota bacterium]
MSDLNRRNFLKLSSLTGAGLVLGFRLPDSAAAAVKDDLTVVNMRRQDAAAFSPNVFLSIDTGGIITVQIPRSELGQGVNTTLAMLIAEELDADWSMVRTEQAPPGSAYGNQVTGGSRTIAESYSGFRMAGATARAMLISAAALTWNVPPDTCTAEQGVVIHTATDQRLTYGELVAAASTLEVPKRTDVTLKAETDFKLIGTRVPSKDAPDMVTGRAIYTSDVRLEGMLVGVVARCPVFGGKVASYDASAALAVEGVQQVVEISSGIAVVAHNTWAALKGRDALVITWDEGKYADLNSETIRQMMMEQAVQTDLDQNADVTQYLEAIYELPYLAHAPMEPLSAAADVRADSGDIWGMTQNRSGAQNAARNAADVPMALHVPLIGGQFGRGHWFENIEDAAEVSRLVAAPVRVIWTREDDMQHDHYRPASVHWVRAGLDASGQPITWEHHIGAQGIDGGGSELLEGAYMPY